MFKVNLGMYNIQCYMLALKAKDIYFLQDVLKLCIVCIIIVFEMIHDFVRIEKILLECPPLGSQKPKEI